jgi:hypothetical protein
MAQSEPNGVFSFQQLTSEPERNHPFAKPLYGLKPVPGVRIGNVADGVSLTLISGSYLG